MKNMAGLKCVKGRVSSHTWKNETVSFFHVCERSGSFMSHACIALTGRLLSVQVLQLALMIYRMVMTQCLSHAGC